RTADCALKPENSRINSSWPVLDGPSTSLLQTRKKDVDDPGKPGHDDFIQCLSRYLLLQKRQHRFLIGLVAHRSHMVALRHRIGARARYLRSKWCRLARLHILLPRNDKHRPPDAREPLHRKWRTHRFKARRKRYPVLAVLIGKGAEEKRALALHA